MAHDLLHGYGVATFESAVANGALGRLVAELDTFSGALTSSDALRQVLSDPAISSSARRAVVADLLGGRASTESTALIDFALRVVRPGELPLALADLAIAAAERQAGEADTPTTTRSLFRDRVRGYAERVFEELAGMEELDVVEEELFALARLVEANPPLRQALASPVSPLTGRLSLLGDLIGGRVTPATLRLASYVLAAGTTRDLVGSYEWLVDLAAEERGRRVAQVRSAVALSEEERRELARVLSPLVSREVEVRVIEDPTVIGGVLVSVGDLLVDGTVRLRFERLREAIAQWA